MTNLRDRLEKAVRKGSEKCFFSGEEANLEFLRALIDCAVALEFWVEWENAQIKKEGEYHGARINQLIKGGRETLAALECLFKGGEK